MNLLASFFILLLITCVQNKTQMVYDSSTNLSERELNEVKDREDKQAVCKIISDYVESDQ